MQVVRALARTHEGLTHTELIKKAGISSGGWLKGILDELEASGLISSLPLFGNKLRHKKYRVTDEFTLFYLRWMESVVYPNKSPPSATYWEGMHSTAAYRSWCGYSFENLCLKHISEIFEALKISVVGEGISYWRHSPKNEDEPAGAQIDLVIERRDRTINLCEIKFYSEPFKINREYADRLNQRREAFRTMTGFKGSLFNTFICASGVEDSAALFSSVDQKLDLSHLFLKI